MLHGLLVGNLASWYFTGAQTLSRTHRVLLYDLRGHGRSERAPVGYDVETLTDDLEALLDTHFAEPAVVVGHSYGALVGLRFALRHPERVARLVLVEAPLPPSDQGDLSAFLSRRPEEMVDALPTNLQEIVRRGEGRRVNRLLDSLYFLAMESTLLEDVGAEADLRPEELARVQCPVLCIYGKRSSCRPVGERLVAALPNARLVELDGGHFLTMDDPQGLMAALGEFVHG